MSNDVLHLKNNELSVELSRFGGSLLAATWRGIPFLKPTATAGIATQRFGAEASFPLVPFGNRIEGNSFTFEGERFTLEPNTSGDPFCLHGDGWLSEWELKSHSGERATLSYVHAERAGSPYAYEAVQDVRLEGSTLLLSLAVTNTSTRLLPFGLGHHPYFPRTAGTRLRARAKRIWGERAGHLPDAPGAILRMVDFAEGNRLPARWMNNAYDGWDGEAAIEWPERQLALRLEAEGSFECFMIYSPGADADFFCFEPMTHLPNAHNMPNEAGGLVALKPGKSLAGTIRFRLAPLSPGF
ncbi:aldose 1-epimerase [Sinorhizobium terangae]|uniref:Aldose 1-epimerase n=1 Tax=Sinorhizobium terangae TaxID=110322 RepID=A0A6N7LFF6_SINTE|nr:aldose 1-epimerase [Sinorhizobium terangae]MBB4184452.1 aldose 1-epimerase [Sinorhizobium terangae]MQX16326.1 aldose 1-epimerase [Sinorhizobium terangae]WFU50411.1 aldose 1-epimerase [Sinorhizobium terangae]